MRKALTFARPLRANFPSLAFAAATMISVSPSLVWAQAAPQPAPETPAPTPEPPADSSDTETPPAPAPTTDAEATEDGAEPVDGAAPADGSAPADGTTPEPEPLPADEAPAEQEPLPAFEPAPASAEANVSFGAYPNPADDKKALETQGEERPGDIEPNRVFAEEWWSHTRPTIEFHGNFRVRANLYHNFHLNRVDPPGQALWARPADDSYTDINGNEHLVEACTPDEVTGSGSDSPGDADQPCSSPTQMGANMRFRIEPTIIISDNLRIRSQIDLLGNLVMGSTAQGDINYPGPRGYTAAERSGYTYVSGVASAQNSPVSGINSVQDAITVRRAWAEYETPFGQLKFGRMADNWGLGIVYNAGDDLDGDYQSNVDRIAFTTGLPSLSLYAGGSWDFTDEGATSAAFTPDGGQPYDLAQKDDVSRMNLMLYRKLDPQLQALELAKGNVVLNGGLYLSYRYQRLANDYSGAGATCETGAAAIDCQPGETSPGLVRRGMKIVTPDVYGEVLYKKFRAAFEVVTHQGAFESLGTLPGSNDYDENNDEGWRVNQWGLATEIDQKLVEDRLTLGFRFGWASGDGDVNGLVPGNGVQTQFGDREISTFRFHPGYRVDLILNRNILTRVQGTYYFKPMAQYDFIRKANGLRVGGRAEAIWTRASEFMQTPGHSRDLGIELNGTVYYQSKDGVLNTREDLTGGFYSMAQYGVLFPLSGLGYLANQEAVANQDLSLKAAQTVRVFLGVSF